MVFHLFPTLQLWGMQEKSRTTGPTLFLQARWVRHVFTTLWHYFLTPISLRAMTGKKMSKDSSSPILRRLHFHFALKSPNSERSPCQLIRSLKGSRNFCKDENMNYTSWWPGMISMACNLFWWATRNNVQITTISCWGWGWDTTIPKGIQNLCFCKPAFVRSLLHNELLQKISELLLHKSSAEFWSAK